MAAAPVQVRVQGLDPKGVKAAAAPFCSAKNGLTTLSASGLRLNLSDSEYAVLVPGSLFVPFIQPTRRNCAQGCTSAQLLPSTTISCLSVNAKESDRPYPSDVTLHTILELHDAAAISQQLLSSHDLAFGWALAQPADNPTQLSPTSATLLAVLLPPSLTSQASLALEHLAQHLSHLANLLPHRIYRPGLPVSLVGSPFGCLAPRHFTNMTIQGIISAFLPISSPETPTTAKPTHNGLLLIDAHCLPGMEGAPIFTSDGDLLGLLSLPLTRGETEVNVALTIHTIAEAFAQLTAQHSITDSQSTHQATNTFTSQPAKLLPLQQPALAGSYRIPHSANTGYHVAGQGSSLISPSSVDSGSSADSTRGAPAQPAEDSTQGAQGNSGAWMGSNGRSSTGPAGAEGEGTHPGVVLIKSGSSWASGVVASASGIIFTSAHLFPSNPSSPLGFKSPDSPDISPYPALYPQGPVTTPIRTHPSSTNSAATHPDPSAPLQVRITTGSGASWHPAAVIHIFRGHLDVAVLQLQGTFPSVSPVQLWATPLTSASEGLPVTVVGHAMFGPSSGLPPLTTSGNLAKVLKVGDKACMVMTSAAVHSGASGGAVFGPGGRLVGLVTSNARHARGTVLPHLNFAIAADELRPLWRLAVQLQGRTDRGKKGEGRSWLKELRSMDVNDPESDRLWSLTSQAEAEVVGDGVETLEDKLRRLKPEVAALPIDSHLVQGRIASKL